MLFFFPKSWLLFKEIKRIRLIVLHVSNQIFSIFKIMNHIVILIIFKSDETPRWTELCDIIGCLNALFSSVHCVHNSFIYWNHFSWNLIKGQYLDMLMVLTCTCIHSWIEKCKTVIECFHRNTNCFKITEIKQICLLFHFFL